MIRASIILLGILRGYVFGVLVAAALIGIETLVLNRFPDLNAGGFAVPVMLLSIPVAFVAIWSLCIGYSIATARGLGGLEGSAAAALRLRLSRGLVLHGASAFVLTLTLVALGVREEQRMRAQYEANPTRQTQALRRD